VNYYNENDKFAAAWLKELIYAGHLPAGDVDTRSIRDVRPDDLKDYTQCHFFAGIGGWSLALKLAGWPSSRPVWTQFRGRHGRAAWQRRIAEQITVGIP